MFAIMLLAIGQLAPVPATPEPLPPTHVFSRKLVIIHDDSRDSRLLVAELTRDWTKGRQSPPAVYLWAELQAEVMKSVKLVSRKDAGRDFFHITSGYPFYRLGERGALRKFHPNTFEDSGRPLLTLRAITENEFMDLSEWKAECENITLQAEVKHYEESMRWLLIAAPDMHESVWNYHEWGLADNFRFVEHRKKFGSLVGFPELVIPTLPPSPLKKMPWEDGYELPTILKQEPLSEFAPPPPPEQTP